MRGYITGVTSTALWYRYSQGERSIYGIDFPDGLHKNDLLPQPVITPTTKARDGGHDERITSAEVVAQGLVSAAPLGANLCRLPSPFSAAARRSPAAGGLILVDTKYEFGLSPEGEVTLIDEVHTPDSSRFWLADTYEQRIAGGPGAGQLRQGVHPALLRCPRLSWRRRSLSAAPDLAVQAAARYIRTYELLTGQTFAPAEQPAAPRVEHNLTRGSLNDKHPYPLTEPVSS